MDNMLKLPCDVSQVSDGYHTFEELYEHRCMLWINLLLAHPEKSFRTMKNDAGEQMTGWFIGGMETDDGQVTYHLPEKYWDLLDSIQTIERNNSYDGHSSDQVRYRLRLMALKTDTPKPMNPMKRFLNWLDN